MEWSMSTIQLATLVPLTVVAVDAIRRFIRDRIERKGHPLPPGPTPLPFFGNALSVDMHESFRTYTEWRAMYGDIIYVCLLGTDVVVLNSYSVAYDLLEKRSRIYCDRPPMATIDLYGHNIDFAFTRYGDHWRLCRRIFHQTFRADAIASFRPIQLRKARQLITSLMDYPSNYKFHYSTFSGGIAMCSVYDHDPMPRNDPLVSMMNDFMVASLPALLPEKAALLNMFPFILYVPDAFPGSRIKREARLARELSEKIVEEPYQDVRRRMRSGEGVGPSMVANHVSLMEELHPSQRSQYEMALKQASATAFLASEETTASVLMTFTLAMVRNPHTWRRAQADIDAVVGMDRLPVFEDRPSLPYVDAILRETLRWQPSVPVPIHATTSSDIYDGFYIPKGATIVLNVWAMSRDETRYPNPEAFIPERFLDVQGNLTDDLPDFVFGLGRRICPGRHIVKESLWIAMVTLLATFEFNPAKDVDGKDVEFEAKFANGIARSPLTFPCCITPRPHVQKEYLQQVLLN